MDDISVVVLFIAGTSLMSIFVFFLVIYLQVQKRKQNRFRIEKEQLEQEVLRTGLEVKEQAINTMSRELHDNIGSRLNAVMRFLHVIQATEDKGTLTELVKESQGLLGEVIKDARNISHVLNSDYVMNHGLVEAVQKEVDFVKRSTGIDAMVLVEGDYYNFNSGHELIVFRTIQEAISNTIKYAKATNLRISMRYTERLFELKITDNGTGFDTDAAADGIGLANMKNRARMLKADFALLSKPGEGTTLLLTLNTKQ